MCAHVKVLWLDSKGLLDLELVRRVLHGEVEILQENSKDQESLLPGKGSADAGSHTVAERLPAIGKLFIASLKLCIEHPFWAEFLCIFTICNRITMDLAQVD